ncbi:MAG: polyphosphate kinase 1 [Kiritimatiellae bacterium]|nr:polyphosphate kinase 1 [Kiritimatiellia bacterium]MDW8458720.1 polyphosphate kinase 1 [Verrucomicrobiota bacterium]
MSDPLLVAPLPSAEPRLFNRELSWLAFNYRVLEEALDETNPLLERLKFLSIVSSNLDEFFMVRVGGLQMLRAEGRRERDAAGLDPEQQLSEISRRTHEMVAAQYACLLEKVLPGLAAAGIRYHRVQDLPAHLIEHLEQVFNHEIFPVLSPVAIESPEDPPLIPGLTLHLAVRLKSPDSLERKPRFAVVTLSKKLGRFPTLPIEEGHNYALLEDLVTFFIERLFPGETVRECVPFRVTRNADMSVREDLAADLLAEMKDVLQQRRNSACVRLEVAENASKTTLAFLQRMFAVDDAHTYLLPGPLDLAAYMSLARMTGFDHLREKPWPPQPLPGVAANESMFDVIRRGDVLLYHPYQSFDPVVRFIEEAADDPDVLAIKQILYRTSENSPVVAALARAAARDKHVTALVELKARFDEARNIGWAEALEQTGVQVIYGLKRLKTHAKICIVVRREPGGIRRYVHFGTGNYNEITARIYADVSLMTCNEDFGADATAFFNMITGYSQPVAFRRIEAAPIGLRPKLLSLIEGEIQRHQQGQKGHIMVKVNSLVDGELIDALYRASQAGVRVQLSVRGICCLRPGIPGLSENITVSSVVDRFLEHARILYFRHGGDPLVFISSADWMPRNLDRRVELLVPVDDPTCKERLIQWLKISLEDEAKARLLRPDGSYMRHPKRLDPGALRSQAELYRIAADLARKSAPERRVIFEPQRPVHSP